MLEYRFAQLTLGATLFLLFVGATVHPTGSSLACPEWLFVPTCNYEVTPEMKGGVLFEHGHRLAAFAVGILTVALSMLVWRRRRGDRVAVRLAFGALGLVVFQGALGGITVLLRLSAAVSTAHLGSAMAFLGVVLALAMRLRPSTVRKALDEPGVAVARRFALAAVVALYAQILLGGVVRHLGAALTCIDIPLCGGQVWPSAPLQQIHMIHRFGAVAAGVLLVAAAILAWRASRPGLRALASVVVGLVAAQIVLGIYSVLTFIQLYVVVAHLMVGALLFAAALALYLRLRSAGAIAEPAPEAGARSRGLEPVASR